MSDSLLDREKAFRAAVAAADPKALLDAAEAAGNRDDALVKIGALVGYSNRFPQQPGDLNFDERRALNQIILQKLFDLRPIAKAKNYAWYF
jgi:hypothetical protein